LFSAFGTGTGPGFQCSIDGSTPEPCSSPKVDYGLDNGDHTFAVRATDSLGADQTPATRTWTVDATPPDTSIASGPAPGGTSGPTPNFTFSSPEAGSTFVCSLDGAGFGSCNPSGLSAGSHVLLARAVDPVGNVDPIPVSRTWTVDATPPDTNIDSGPAQDSLTNRRTAVLRFSSEAGATFECAIDAGAFAPCTSPRSFSGLGDGTHLFAVRARDSAGNPDPVPATRRWRIDSHPPRTTITQAKVKGRAATFRFRSSEAHSRFTCRLDRGKARSCRSPRRYTHLKRGRHTFRVYATDAANNADRTPAKRSFTI
jgi:hypothetical protein